MGGPELQGLGGWREEWVQGLTGRGSQRDRLGGRGCTGNLMDREKGIVNIRENGLKGQERGRKCEEGNERLRNERDMK
jgi:hypothetical protein